MDHSYKGAERRKYVRITRNFNLVFYLKNSPEKKDVTVIKNISKGGIRFTSSHSIKEGMTVLFEITIPYIAPKKLILEGLVVASREISPGILYAIGAKFNTVNDQAMQVLDMIEKLNTKDQKTHGLH